MAVVGLKFCIDCTGRFFTNAEPQVSSRYVQMVCNELLTSPRFARARRHAGVFMKVKREFRYISPKGRPPRIFTPGTYQLNPTDNEEDREMLDNPWISRDLADGYMELLDGSGGSPSPQTVANKASEILGGVPICCIMGEDWWRATVSAVHQEEIAKWRA